MVHAIVDTDAERRTFTWSIPRTFNFAVDVVDHFAMNSGGPALVWANAEGAERRFSYSDMSRLTRRFASALHRRGLRKGDRVVVMMPRVPEWQIAMVACLRIGAVPIPCIEMLTPKDVTYRVRHAGATAVIARASQARKFDGLKDQLAIRVALGEARDFESMDMLIAEGDEGFQGAEIRADDPAILYYTSGSTGDPKGVLHASRALFAWRNSAIHWLDLKRGDIIWCTADVGWSKAGTSILFGPWSCGACAFFFDGPFEPRQRLAMLEKYAVTVYCAPGTEFFRVVAEDVGACDLSKLRHAVTAGEALSPVVADRWRRRTGIPILEAYGQTETLMTLLNYPAIPLREGSMGLAGPGLDLDVIDTEGRRLPPGTEGDLALLTPCPQLMLGYWNDERRTVDCHVDGPDGRWFITGDLAEKDADGYFYHRGRRDDVINSAGYRIGPSEVENALLDHPSVLECAAIGAPDSERGEVVKAFIVLRPGFHPSDDLVVELQDHAKRVTAPYKYPRRIEFVRNLPKTMTGKLQRRVLRDRERGRFGGAGENEDGSATQRGSR